MTDPFAAFDDLTEPGKDPAIKDFPGGREPVNREPDEPTGRAGWDEKPTVYVVGGKATEFFSIRHVAAAFGRSPVTIRAWENSGRIPAPITRTRTPEGKHLPGTTPRGRRLWTREQIEGMLRIAEEEECILNGTAPTERFSVRANNLFKEIRERDYA